MPKNYRFRMGMAWFFRVLFTAPPLLLLIDSVRSRGLSSAPVVPLLIALILPLIAWAVTGIHVIVTDQALIIRGIFRRRIPLQQIKRCWYARTLKGEPIHELITATKRSWGTTRIWGERNYTMIDVGSRTIALDLATPYEFSRDLESRRARLLKDEAIT